MEDKENMTYRKKYCIDKVIVSIHWSEEMRPESVSYKTQVDTNCSLQ